MFLHVLGTLPFQFRPACKFLYHSFIYAGSYCTTQEEQLVLCSYCAGRTVNLGIDCFLRLISR